MNKLIKDNSRSDITVLDIVVVIIVLTVMISITFGFYIKYINKLNISTDRQTVETIRAAMINAQTLDKVYGEISSKDAPTITITISNSSGTITSSNSKKTVYMKAIMEEINIESTKLLNKDSSIVIIAKPSFNGYPIISIKTTGYPEGTFVM